VLGTFGTNVTLAILAAGTGVIAARTLGPSGRGELVAIQTWPSFLATLAMLGLPEALVYYVARGVDNPGRYVGSATAAALTAAFALYCAGWLLMPALLGAQSASVVSAARLYLLIVPIFALAGMPFHAFRGQGNFLAWNVFRFLPPFGWLGVLLAGMSIGDVKAADLAAMYLVVLALQVGPMFLTARRLIAGPFVPKKSLLKPLLRYGLPNAATGIPQLLNLRLDQMLMAGVLPREKLGLYAAALAWSSAVAPLPAALGSVVSPRLAGHTSIEDQRGTAGAYVRRAVVISALLGIATALASPMAVRIFFGSAFSAAVPAAVVLSLAAGVLGVNYVVEEVLRGLGLPGLVLRGESAGVVVTAVGLAVFLPTLGIVGAGVASLLGYLSVLAFLISRLGEKLGTGPGVLLWPRRADLTDMAAKAGETLRRGVRKRRRQRSAGS